MVDEGYAKVVADNKESKHDRKVYEITEKGAQPVGLFDDCGQTWTDD
jgi:DNA-binding PadR family transcriptional regulator